MREKITKPQLILMKGLPKLTTTWQSFFPAALQPIRKAPLLTKRICQKLRNYFLRFSIWKNRTLRHATIWAESFQSRKTMTRLRNTCSKLWKLTPNTPKPIFYLPVHMRLSSLLRKPRSTMDMRLNFTLNLPSLISD